MVFPFLFFMDVKEDAMGEVNYKYSYNGPVMIFERCVGNWKGETIAPSERKARSNLAYQCKKACNLGPSSKVTLPGKINVVE